MEQNKPIRMPAVQNSTPDAEQNKQISMPALESPTPDPNLVLSPDLGNGLDLG